MEKITVAVFFGGCSPEYSVSLQSAAAVLEALPPERYKAVAVGITPEGRWYDYGGDIQAIREDRWLCQGPCVPAILSPDRGEKGLLLFEKGGVRRLAIDAALPMLHGQLGEDGSIQGLIALAGIPLVGCGVLASALCMNKDRARRLASLTGVLIPLSVMVERGEGIERAAALGRDKGYPLFVKPVGAGSSYGVSRVEREEELPSALELAFRYDSRALVEEAIPGAEVGCAVLGRETLTTGAVDLVELSGGFLDFTEKYTPRTSVTHCPAPLPPKTAEEIQETAKAIYRSLGCSGFARVDLFLTPEGRLVFNEVNTIPGCTPHSRFPAMLAAAGLSLPEVLERTIGEAVER